ncbi:MAG TPA: endo-1,4-beta-xylanase [Capsulimonadaceae bacterium]|nr:endo-1,4-beta-xylanase [Capsulimonadaceae bacterium]
MFYWETHVGQIDRIGATKAFFLAVILALVVAPAAWAQDGFPGSLRALCDKGVVPFRIGTAVPLKGSRPGRSFNGYGPGILTHLDRDKAFQAMVRGQFNQIEPENELKMMNVWTKGAALVNGRYVAQTNLFDKNGPLNQLCKWAESKSPRLTVRGHCIIYNQGYTLPKFPEGQPALFTRNGRQMVLNSPYKPSDLRDMMESYVRQVVDATMAQNAFSRRRYGYKVVEMWDVTNEVVEEQPRDPVPAQLGFAYRGSDPFYNCGPKTDGLNGYDYVGDIYKWATQEMAGNVGKTIQGQKITAADRFELYYNDYNLEWSASKLTYSLALIDHARAAGGEVDGLGFQGHIQAKSLDTKQFDASISAAIADKLRFAITELDCAIRENPGSGQPTVAEQETNQGNEYGEVARLCMAHKASCDCLQIWGATDDGSWIPNAEATPITRWVEDTRPGPTKGKVGYWPKEGQYDPVTVYDSFGGGPDTKSGHNISNAYDQILSALNGG